MGWKFPGCLISGRVLTSGGGEWKIEKLSIYSKCSETNIKKQKQYMNFKHY